MKMSEYKKFLESKRLKMEDVGFEPVYRSKHAFDFQNFLIDWAVRIGRCALVEDCGLGKSLQELAWAENIVRKTNKKVLIITPLAVSFQMLKEAEKFGFQAERTQDGTTHKGINVTNYERLHHFDPTEFVGAVADEAGILKNFEGSTRKAVTDFLSKVRYRLLCTATPAPNDYMELGCHSEALGNMSYNQMLSMFFTQSDDDTQQWRLRGHARRSFWEWIGTWARAVRMPSDIGFKDDGFVLPPLNTHQHVVKSKSQKGLLPDIASTLTQQRKERRDTVELRCQKVADIVPKDRPCIVWCHLNDEGDLLTQLIPGAVQVSGSDKDGVKEERLIGFSKGEIKTLVTKPKIAGFGLNWQHCADMVMFPSHSHEQFYQSVRRCWRFGQKKPVNVNIVTSEAESAVLSNMLRKERQANAMYSGIIKYMESARRKELVAEAATENISIPDWMKA